MTGEPVQRVRIYLNERDVREGQALYVLVLERLRREGATGATALRGMAGFGPGHRMRSAGSVVDAQPVVIEWVDRVDRVARVVPLLDDLVEDALVTIEELRAYRARLRGSGPFGSRSVGDVMAGDALTAPVSATARAALRLLVEHSQPILPVIDEQRRLVAVLSDVNFVRGAGLALPLAVVRCLRPDEREDVLRVVQERPIAELVGEEPRSLYVQSAIHQAVATMIEWGLDALPVVDRDGAFAGLFGIDQALQAALDTQRPSDGAIRDAEGPPPVRLLMQTTLPTAPSTAGAAIVLRQLLLAHGRFVVVVDQGQPVGMLDAAGVLARLEPPLRYEWLQALRAPGSPPALPGAPADLTAGILAEPVATIDELATQTDAIRALIETHSERLLVVSADGLLVGLLGRQGMLRALSQGSG